jgi:hypothetical protein
VGMLRWILRQHICPQCYRGDVTAGDVAPEPDPARRAPALRPTALRPTRFAAHLSVSRLRLGECEEVVGGNGRMIEI